MEVPVLKKCCLILVILLCFTFISALAVEAGSFRLDFFQGGAMGIEFIPILVDEDTDNVLSLQPCCIVTNVRLEKLIWFEDNLQVDPEPLFQADVMEPNQILNITTWIPDTMPKLRIIATNPEGKQECWYISDSGEDGSLLLLPGEDLGLFLP